MRTQNISIINGTFGFDPEMLSNEFSFKGTNPDNYTDTEIQSIADKWQELDN